MIYMSEYQQYIKPIVGYGSEILRTTCNQTDNTEEARKTINELWYTMQSLHTSVGLAAPQINSDLQIFAAKLQGLPEIVINPVIRKRRQNYKTDEGCLSIPGITTREVIKDKIIEVEYYDQNFNKVKKKLSAFDAVVFQHEYDHLHGILYVDRLNDKNLEEIKHKLAQIEEQKTTTYYNMIWPDNRIIIFAEE